MPYVLVTGSAKRIGAYIVNYLALKGWDIIIHYNTSSKAATALRKKIVSIGKDCVLWQQDFADNKNNDDFSKICRKYAIKLIINNASLFLNDNFSTMSFNNFNKHMQVNCWQPLQMLQAFKKEKKTDILHVINIIDAIIFHKPEIFTSYYASRILLNEMTKLAAKDFAPQFRINSIAPGYVLQNEKQSALHFEKNKFATPLQNNCSLVDICTTIDYLENVKSITGQVICLDGGAHLTNKW